MIMIYTEVAKQAYVIRCPINKWLFSLFKFIFVVHKKLNATMPLLFSSQITSDQNYICENIQIIKTCSFLNAPEAER